MEDVWNGTRYKWRKECGVLMVIQWNVGLDCVRRIDIVRMFFVRMSQCTRKGSYGSRLICNMPRCSVHNGGGSCTKHLCILLEDSFKLCVLLYSILLGSVLRRYLFAHQEVYKLLFLFSLFDVMVDPVARS